MNEKLAVQKRIKLNAHLLTMRDVTDERVQSIKKHTRYMVWIML